VQNFYINFLPQQPVEALGLGVFDGYHKGHQVLLARCTHALTFFPHPENVLKSSHIQYLTNISELKLFFNSISVLTFNKIVAELSPQDFIKNIILPVFSPKKVVVGYDFRFGHLAKGSAVWLKAHMDQFYSIEVDIIPPVTHQGIPIKSDQIRQYMRSDPHQNFEKILDCLGHPYLVIGEVVKGEGRGRKIGYPTANLKIVPDKLLPPFGVYKGFTILKGCRYLCMIYVGKKPTFQGNVSVFEVHILDFSENLYDQTLNIYITGFVRGEKTFPSVDALKQQIQLDIQCVE